MFVLKSKVNYSDQSGANGSSVQQLASSFTSTAVAQTSSEALALQSISDEDLFARRGKLSLELDLIDREIARRGKSKRFGVKLMIIRLGFSLAF